LITVDYPDEDERVAQKDVEGTYVNVIIATFYRFGFILQICG